MKDLNEKIDYLVKTEEERQKNKKKLFVTDIVFWLFLFVVDIILFVLYFNF